MRERFVPPAYQHDLRKKIAMLRPGDMSVQDYYAKLQKGMIRAVVHEEIEDKICHFYSGLHTEIQDIVDYKEYNTFNHLFQLAMLAEKNCRGANRRKRRPPSRLVQHLRIHPELLRLLELILNDTFDFPCSFDVIDTFCNNTMHYRPE
jgi:hypothetical protein